MSATLMEQLAVREIAPGEFLSQSLPGRMGNSLPVAYGGCTMGVATAAACSTVPSSYHLYSLVGHYLGPGLLGVKMLCTVHSGGSEADVPGRHESRLHGVDRRFPH